MRERTQWTAEVWQPAELGELVALPPIAGFVLQELRGRVIVVDEHGAELIRLKYSGTGWVTEDDKPVRPNFFRPYFGPPADMH